MTKSQAPRNEWSGRLGPWQLVIGSLFIGISLVIGHWSLSPVILTGCLAKGYHHAHQQPALLAVAKLKLVRPTVELLQSSSRVRDTHTFGCPRKICDPVAVVPHLQEQFFRFAPGAKLNLARP